LVAPVQGGSTEGGPAAVLGANLGGGGLDGGCFLTG